MAKNKKPIVQGGVENYLGKQPQVVAPRKWQSSPDAPPTELAYITKAEKDLILKKDIHGSLSKGPNMGPSGIMSLDSFGDIGGAGAAGVDTDASGGYDTGPGGGGFTGKGPNETKSQFDSRVRNQKEIMQKAEQRQANRLGYRERKNVVDMNRPGRFGIGSLLGTVLGFINPALGLAYRGITSIPGVTNFLDKFRGPKNITDDDDNTTLLDQVSPDLPFAQSYLNQIKSQLPSTVNQPTGIVNTDAFNNMNLANMTVEELNQIAGGP